MFFLDHKRREITQGICVNLYDSDFYSNKLIQAFERDLQDIPQKGKAI